MATDDAMDVESATHGLYMDVEQQPPLLETTVPRPPPAVASSTSQPASGAHQRPMLAPSPDFPSSIVIARRVVVGFLRECKAEDIMPEASRVALIDCDLSLRQAFRALVENGLKAAPIIDVTTNEFCGLLSVSDILDALLRVYYSRPSGGILSDLANGLDDYSVRNWNMQQCQESVATGNTGTHSFIYALAEESLFDAIRVMRDTKMLYLPVLSNDSAPLHILEHWRVMRFLHRHFTARDGSTSVINNSATTDPRHATRLFNLTLSQLNLGTYRNLVKIPPSTPLLRCLQIMQQHELFALPVVNERNQLVEVYSRADVALLAGGGCNDSTLHRTVMEVLHDIRRGMPFVGVTCAKGDMLGSIFERFEKTGVQRMYVIGRSGVEGVVSLVTLLRYFLQGF